MSIQDPLRRYMEKKSARASLALLRTLIALVAGMAGGLLDGVWCLVAPLVYVTTYLVTMYVGPWARRLGGKDNYTAGILSSPAALLLGYFLGSVL